MAALSDGPDGMDAACTLAHFCSAHLFVVGVPGGLPAPHAVLWCAGPARASLRCTSNLVFCCCYCWCCCRSVLRQLVGDFEYFLGILPDGSGLAAPLNPGFKAPIQLGRQVLAQLAGAPER